MLSLLWKTSQTERWHWPKSLLHCQISRRREWRSGSQQATNRWITDVAQEGVCGGLLAARSSKIFEDQRQQDCERTDLYQSVAHSMLHLRWSRIVHTMGKRLGPTYRILLLLYYINHHRLRRLRAWNSLWFMGITGEARTLLHVSNIRLGSHCHVFWSNARGRTQQV